MKLKFLVPLVLFAGSFYLSAQENGKENYSKKERTAFAKIYQHTLDNPFDIASSMKKCVKALHISEKRMTEILQAQFAGNDPKLSNEEIKQLEKLKVLMDKDKEEYDKGIAKFIVANKMQTSKYKEIEKAYQSNNKFQAEVYKLSVKKSKN